MENLGLKNDMGNVWKLVKEGNERINGWLNRIRKDFDNIALVLPGFTPSHKKKNNKKKVMVTKIMDPFGKNGKNNKNNENEKYEKESKKENNDNSTRIDV